MKFRDEVPGTSDQSFLKLKDGESVAGVFRGELYDFFAAWNNKVSSVVPEGAPGAKFRFRINFITKGPAGYVAKVLEQGSTVYRDLKTLHEEYDLEQTVVKITRHGSTMNDTSYSLMPLRTPVTEEVKNVPLLDLRHKQTSGKPSSASDIHRDFGDPPPDFGGGDDAIPF